MAIEAYGVWQEEDGGKVYMGIVKQALIDETAYLLQQRKCQSRG